MKCVVLFLLYCLSTILAQDYQHINGVTYAFVTSGAEFELAINYRQVNSGVEFVIELENSITLSSSISVSNLSFTVTSSVDEQFAVSGGGDGDFHGGGIHMLLLSENSNVKLENLILEGGLGQYAEGGAVQLHSGSFASFSRCWFRKNYAEFGGAVFVGGGSTVTFDQTKFDHNSAENVGGVVLDQASHATFTRCSFANNTATSFSNDLALFGNSKVEFFSNCSANSIPGPYRDTVDCSGCDEPYPANLRDANCVSCPEGLESGKQALECTAYPSAVPSLFPVPEPSWSPHPSMIPTPDLSLSEWSRYVAATLLFCLVIGGVTCCFHRRKGCVAAVKTPDSAIELATRSSPSADSDSDSDNEVFAPNHWSDDSSTSALDQFTNGSNSPKKQKKLRKNRTPWGKKKQLVLEASDYMDYA